VATGDALTDGTGNRPADWRTAPALVKALVIPLVAAGITEWAYGPHVRANPGAFAVAAVIVVLLMGALLRGHMWAWVLIVAIFLVDLTGLRHGRHPVHRPLPIAIAIQIMYALLLFSPAMLRWVGVSQRWSRRTRQLARH
jgi:hypothetical protein